MQNGQDRSRRNHSSARGIAARYGVAVAALAGATLVRWLVDPALGDHLPYVSYFVAIAFVAWSCGLGPSVLTLLAGAWLADFLFLSPRYAGYPHVHTPQHAVGIGTYFMVGISSIAACEAVRRAALREIADRRRAEAALRESAEALRRQKEQFTTLVEHIPDIVARLDRELRFLYISPSVRAVTGIPPEDYLGKLRTNAGIPDQFARERDALSHKVFQTGQEYSLEFPIETLSSGQRLCEMRLIPEFAPDGSVESLMTLTRDITERKQAEEALRESNRRKDEFLATLAHELRGPLAPLANMLQILKREGADPEALRQARDVMERQLRQMTRLVDDLLDVSRISLGKMELKRQRIELASVVRTAVESSRPIAERFGHELIVQVPPEPIPLDADPVRLAQVLANLLNNASKFTPAGGRIWLTAERQDDEVVIRVRDNGIGIPPEKLESVFEMFTQVSMTMEQSQGGLGIGLTLVKRLIDMHGGTVTAHSDGAGQGSEFVVRLPVASPVAAASESPTTPSREQKIETILRRILVVDDNRDAASSLARLLKLDGHDVHTAHDGHEAVEAAQRVNPDLILLDIGLPKLNGYDACRQIRTQQSDRRPIVVALTGWGQEEDRQKSKAAGFDAHLVKPVDYQRLTKLVNELVTAGAAAPGASASSNGW